MKIASDINRRSMKPQTELAVSTRILDFLLTDWRDAACIPVIDYFIRRITRSK